MASAAPAAGAARGSAGSSSTFLLLLAVFAILFMMFDPAMRTATAEYVGLGLNPVFGGMPAIWILFIVGSIMVLANTIIRHFFTDWLKMARVQEVMRAFNKEFGDARKSNNTFKIKRLTEMQPDLMKMQTELSGQQIKPMIFTMIIVLPIFGWLFHVIDPATDVCNTVLEVPWAAPGSWCADHGTDWVGFIPRWIAIYSLLSIPIGQVVQRALKLWEYRHVDLDADGVPAGKST